MSYRILIRAFTLRRDIAVSMILKRLLENRGCEVMIASSRNYIKAVKYWKPHAIVINAMSQASSAKKLSPKSRIIHWPGEGGEPEHCCDSVTMMNKPHLYEALDKILFWGHHEVEYFKKFMKGTPLDKIDIIGNPRFDLLMFDKQVKYDNKSKSLGFVGRFNSINHYDGRPTTFSLNYKDNRHLVIDQCKGYATCIDIMRDCAEKTDLKFSFRPHPLENPKSYGHLNEIAKGRVTVDDSYYFGSWAAKHKALITPSSTSFLEAYILGVPIINIDKLADFSQETQNLYLYATLSMKAGYNPESLEEAFELITNENTKGKKVDEIDEHLSHIHLWPRNFSSLKLTADKIIEDLDKNAAKINKGVPKFAIDAIDALSFARVYFKDKTHPNFNYFYGYHKEPESYIDITQEIENFDNSNANIEI